MIFLDLEYINKKILEVYKECNIRSFPIDCFSVLKHYGLQTITYKETKEQNPELYKAIYRYSNDAFRFRMSVYYNSTNSDGRIRFSLIHELGHYILGHTEESSDNEDEANTFASNFLAPRPITFQQGLKTAEQIRDYYGISISAANQALVSPFYLPDKNGEELLGYFKSTHKTKYKIADTQFKVKYPDPIQEKEWIAETERLDSEIAKTQAKMFTCKTEKQYDKLNKKYNELLIRRLWQDDIAHLCGYDTSALY